MARVMGAHGEPEVEVEVEMKTDGLALTREEQEPLSPADVRALGVAAGLLRDSGTEEEAA